MSDYRSRSNSEVLDAAFEIFRSHFAVFFAIGVIATLPGALSFFLTGGKPSALALNSPTFPLVAGMTLGSLILYPFITAAITAAASFAYLGQPVDIVSATRAAFRHPFRVFFVELRKGIFMGLGFVLFLIPTFIVFKRYFAVPATTVLEDSGVSRSVHRSRELSAGNGSRIFALLFGTWCFIFIVSIMMQTMAGAIRLGILGSALYLVVLAAITPFYSILAVVLYYDIRIRKEAFDIDLMSQEIDAVPATT